jgi:hypothetical protein
MDDGKNSIGSNDMLDISGYVYIYIIEMDDGKFYRKTHIFDGKNPWVSG